MLQGLFVAPGTQRRMSVAASYQGSSDLPRVNSELRKASMTCCCGL